MEKFISCDWGTSSFRLRLIEAATKNILAETRSAQGIAATYALWKEQDVADRILFYTGIILQQIIVLEQQCGYSLDDITILISGMASATIGMMELPYKFIPLQISKAELQTHVVPATGTCRHTIIIISGVRSATDVMRGEETMLAGCAVADMGSEQLFIFPGTHSKHVVVQNGVLKDFKTYMTGEIFDLLTSKSILAASIEEDSLTPQNSKAFINGVKESVDANILNTIFHVRTNQLFGAADKNENYHYLSGLLIGEELKDVQTNNYASVMIVASGALLSLYPQALSILAFKGDIQFVNADNALINGQALIFDLYK